MDARRAGVGDFDVVIKGASKATIEYIEEKESVYKVKYHVAQPGDYRIVIKYNNIHIPGKNAALWATLWVYLYSDVEIHSYLTICSKV